MLNIKNNYKAIVLIQNLVQAIPVILRNNLMNLKKIVLIMIIS